MLTSSHICSWSSHLRLSLLDPCHCNFHKLEPKSNLEICHYNFLIPLTIPFSPIADPTQPIILHTRRILRALPRPFFFFSHQFFLRVLLRLWCAAKACTTTHNTPPFSPSLLSMDTHHKAKEQPQYFVLYKISLHYSIRWHYVSTMIWIFFSRFCRWIKLSKFCSIYGKIYWSMWSYWLHLQEYLDNKNQIA
jgi:hypothetical protein